MVLRRPPTLRATTRSRWGGATLLASALGLTLTVPFSPVVGAAAAEPDDPARGLASTKGRGPATATRVAEPSRAPVVRRAAAAPSVRDPLVMPTSYPSQPQLRLYRDNPDDAADTPQLLTHPDLAPQLTEWMKSSDRISTQVVGQSTEGRDLYLVTVTAPEREEDTAQQTAWREEIESDPVAAAADRTLQAQYKTPVWFSANIHGNEWEGTDAVMRYIDRLVTAPESEVGSILRNNRLYFSLSLNPDGRTNATRATALGLDPNRDMITDTTPEATSFVRTAQAIQPIYSADLHGYTSVLQVEPTGPPHGSNYEYDVYLPHNYALALDVEQDVVAADIPGNTYFNTTTGTVVPANTGPETAHIKIPYRDTPSGWDDFPPIFTAQYAAFEGASTSTVELPLRRGAANGSRQTPERARVNVAVGTQTIMSMVDYMTVPTHARDMLRNQIEVFRRGAAGEPKTPLTQDRIAAVPGPAQWKPLWDAADDQDPVDLPRAYVIPVGDDQRSASDASRLVDQLLFHDIEVGRLTADTAAGGTTYPAGSYVVDLHQPKRGLANSLLDLGEDITAKVPTMYDISAWSYASLWGATVDSVGSTSDAAPVGATTPVTAASSDAAVPESGPYAFDVAGVDDVRALNAMLEAGVPVSLLADGTAVVGSSSRTAVGQVSEQFDLPVRQASAADRAALEDPSTRDLEDLTIAYAGTQDERLSFSQLGFDDLVPVTGAGIQAAAAAGTPTGLEDADVLWVGSELALTEGSAGRAAVQAFVDAGGSVLGRGADGFDAASTYGLVSGTAVDGNPEGNGIVAVDTDAESFLAPFGMDEAFIYPATWFTGLGEGTTVEQRYADDPLLAGHWRPTEAGTGGSDAAAGQASVVSGEAASGARSVVFGTSVFFRTHPKGQMGQVGRSLFWAAGEAPDEGSGPKVASSTTLRVVKTGAREYRLVVSVDTGDAPRAGTVVVRDRGAQKRVIRVDTDRVERRTIRLGPGRHVLKAQYGGTPLVAPSASGRSVVRVG